MSADTHRPAHRWRFNRLGGFDQVMIDSGEDIRHLPELDPKLWAALSCPTSGLEFDSHTLALLDTDGDGRIRIDEIKEAVHWTCRRLKDPGDLFKHGAGLPLDAIDDSTEEGRLIMASAWRILDNLGRTESTVITAAETANTTQIFAGSRFNGDGVVQPSAARDESVAQAISDIMRCVGSLPDRSGEDGIDQALCDRFFAEAREYLEWWAQAEADAANILPLGEDTESAAELFESVKTKIDDYFTRARLADYDQRAAELLNPAESDYAALAGRTLSLETEDLAGFPLARVEPGRALPLRQMVNPRWARDLDAFRTRVVAPLLGDIDSLSETQWLDLSKRFEAHSVWRSHRRGALVAPLGATRLRALVEGPFQAAIADLIEQDLELAGVSDAIESVDRLVHYYQHLEPLLQNFVSLRDFYTPGRKAVFQAGTLYLDGRACDLCVRVDDPAKHAALANLSQIYLAYCDCRRRGGTETLTIAAAFTAGDGDNLMVGRNGVFYDRNGDDWDATIVKIVEHPISAGQAFWSPYKRLGRMISQQIEKFAGARDKAVDTGAEQGVTTLATKAQEPSAGGPAPAPFDIAKFAGIFAAIGLAVGAIGTALASVMTGLLSLSWWQIPLALLGLMLAISGPSMLLAHLKLRQRNLAPLLDANGWAVNAQAKISIPFGAMLTSTAQLPKGAARSLRDPFAEKKRPWKTYLVLLALLAGLILAWREGYLAARIERLMLQQAAETPAVEPAAPVAESGEPATEAPATAKPATEAPAETPEPVAPSTDEAAPDSAESTPATDKPAAEPAN
ncbi:hypothetical protein [Allochromatium tepidum]|uniref:EF-hand domain-containing protein n=1 Tax=Allochromatium tepidum TaxID=553982 RepID=A0ABM7QQI8_9GAMM|nr:hypothetical protein [Allochromatium tepidum]BCU07779.1 hypothetical protein Atep_24560 [Allochromatium tepidum]